MWDQGQSATAAKTELKIGNNVTWRDAFQFGQPGDFTWTLDPNWEMEIKLDRYQATPLLNPSTANGEIVVADANQRVIYMNVSSAVIQASLQPGVYVYDLIMFDNSNPPIRSVLMYGPLTVVQGVSQA
jgi:hypothetical protein